jgi:hypothetical protein
LVTPNDMSFIENLDSVRQNRNQKSYLPENEINRISQSFKLSALFSNSIILLDTQFVDNFGFRELFLRDKGFRRLLNETTFVGMREGVSDFTSLVNSQLSKKMIFSSLEDSSNKMIRDAGEINSIEKLPNTGRIGTFKNFIARLDDEYLCTAKKVDVRFDSYADNLKDNIEARINDLQSYGAKKICLKLLDKLNTKEEEDISRSDLYSLLEKYKSEHSTEDVEIVRRFFIDLEYNRNFWYTNKFNCLTHSDDEDISLYNKAFPKYNEKLLPFTKSDTTEFSLSSEGRLYLDYIDFDFIASFREKNKAQIEKHFDRIQKYKSDDDTNEKFDKYIDFLLPQVNEYYEGKGWGNFISKSTPLIDIVSVGITTGIGLAGLYPEKIFGTSHLSPELTFCLAGATVASGVLVSIANLVNSDHENRRMKQNKRYCEFERCLKSTTFY